MGDLGAQLPTISQRISAVKGGAVPADQKALIRDIAVMHSQRAARIKRRDDMLDWLRAYETWREEHGRPIAYVGTAADQQEPAGAGRFETAQDCHHVMTPASAPKLGRRRWRGV